MTERTTRWATLVATILGVGFTGNLHAQQETTTIVLEGRVVDGPSRRPLPDTYVSVFGTRARTVTGPAGEFRLRLPRDTVYVITVGRLGYAEMDYRITAVTAERNVVLPLEPAPIVLEELEVSIDRLQEMERRLHTRTRGADMSSRVIGRDDIDNSTSLNALDVVLDRGNGMLFECFEPRGELCARARAAPTMSSGGASPTIATVLVCIDESKAFGSLGFLQSIPAEEIHRIEFYGFNGRDQIRVYTRYFMVRAAAQPRALGTLDSGC